MEVAVSALRAELKTWLERARAGDDVVVTERGVPVARIVPVAGADLLAGLIRDGYLTAPSQPRGLAEAAEHGAVPSAPDSRTGSRPGAGDHEAERGGVTGLVRRLRR